MEIVAVNIGLVVPSPKATAHKRLAVPVLPTATPLRACVVPDGWELQLVPSHFNIVPALPTAHILLALLPDIWLSVTTPPAGVRSVQLTPFQ